MAFQPQKPLNDTHNPDTYKPRNHMYNVHTKRVNQGGGTFVDFDMITNYADSTNGAINLFGGGRVEGENGVIIKPTSSRIVYIKSFQIIATFYNQVDVDSALDSVGTLDINHNGWVVCNASKFNDFRMISEDAFIEKNTMHPNLYTFSYVVPSYPAGRINGADNEMFNIKMSTDKSPDSENLVSLYFSFYMWETRISDE
ncbi:MAG: hypothetical protein KAS32_14200 [Candidatus Peribacteraceae bacterium]|nr:hypothetical protein [Candidatus Peribacteraceae bacterium]